MTFAEISISDLLHALEIGAILLGGLKVTYNLGQTHKAIEASIAAQQELSRIQGIELTKIAAQWSAEADDLKMEIRSINAILKEVAVQSNRLDRLEADTAELRRGQGMNVEVWGSVLEGAVGRAISKAATREGR